MKRLGAVILLVSMALTFSACSGSQPNEVKLNSKYFPDKKFREVVRPFDTDNDGILTKDERLNIKQLSVSEVNDLTGMELFTNLEELYIEFYLGPDIKFSVFPKLKTLIIRGYNPITKIDLSRNLYLETFYYYDNNRRSLKELVLPSSRSIRSLRVDEVGFKQLDLSGYKYLNDITMGFGYIETLILSNCPSLTKIDCSTNALTVLEIRNCPNLKELHCYDNQIASLNVKGFANLETLVAHKNNLQTVNVTDCPMLSNIKLDENVKMIDDNPAPPTVLPSSEATAATEE